MRTIPNITHTHTHTHFPAFRGRHQVAPYPSHHWKIYLERDLFSLPTRLGGLNIPNPVTTSSQEYSFSRITGPLVRAICQQDGRLDYHAVVVKSQVRREKRAAQLEHAERLHSELPHKLQRLMDLAREKGSSNWLVALPIESHGFLLRKGAFRDAISLRYGWQPSLLPATCTFTVDHACIELSNWWLLNTSSQHQKSAMTCAWSHLFNPFLVNT